MYGTMMTFKNFSCFVLLLLINICVQDVGADINTMVVCMKLNENGSTDDSYPLTACDAGYYCCGHDSIECCSEVKTNTSQSINGDQFSRAEFDDQYYNRYWVTTLAFKIAILIVAIAGLVKYLYRKCNCSKEPEHLVFVNHMTDVNSEIPPYRQDPPPSYQPYPPTTTTGQFQQKMTPNMTSNMPSPNMMTSSMPSSNVSASNMMTSNIPSSDMKSSNMPSSVNTQGYMGPFVIPQQDLSNVNPYSLNNQG